MEIKGKELTKELVAKAIQCDTPEELVKLAEENGVALTINEAEAYLTELENIDLDSNQLKQVAGGTCYGDCSSDKCPQAWPDTGGWG